MDGMTSTTMRSGKIARVTLVLATLLAAGTARAVEDGLGTNYVGVLSATGLELGGTVRSSWPTESGSIGGTVDVRASSNVVVWAPAFRWTGELETLRIQTDDGEADARIVRARWNDAWDSYTVLQDVKATAAGVAASGWSSAWVSNSFRVGILVTNYTTGTHVWWSVDYTRTDTP